MELSQKVQNSIFLDFLNAIQALVGSQEELSAVDGGGRIENTLVTGEFVVSKDL